MEINPNNVYHQTNNDNGTFIGHQEVAHLYQNNKDKSEKIELLYQQRLKDKDSMIVQLQKIVDKLS